MRLRITRRTMAGIVLLVALALIPPMAASADGPTVTVTPSTGLVDGQVVDVAWSGFDPLNPVYLRVCKRGATTANLCDLPSGNNDSAPSSASGGGVIRFLLPIAIYPKFRCSDTQPCDVAVMQDPEDLSTAVRVPFSFAHPPTACPSATVPPVAGEGATSAAYTMYQWENAACSLDSHLNQPVYPLDRVFTGSLHCRPDFLLPGRVGGIADVVALHDKRIAHHPNRWTFHVHAGHGGAVWVIGRKAHVGRGEIDHVLGVCHEESVAAQRQGEVHVRLFRHHKAFEDPIEEVLCGFRMPRACRYSEDTQSLACQAESTTVS